MFFSAPLHNTLSAIRVGFIAKKRFIIIPTSSFTRAFLTSLISLGVISNFRTATLYELSKRRNIQKGKYHTVYSVVTLSYVNARPLFSSVNAVSSPNQFACIKIKALIKAFEHNPGLILVLSTSKGILTIHEAIRLRKGGLILAILSK